MSIPVLRSYVSGDWHTPGDAGRPVFDAVTGEEIARVSSAGMDFAAALAYGREVGGPALRELTFHQRAALLKALGPHLRELPDDTAYVDGPVEPLGRGGTFVGRSPRESAGYGEVRWDADVTRQDGESVARYDVLTLVAKKESDQ